MKPIGPKGNMKETVEGNKGRRREASETSRETRRETRSHKSGTKTMIDNGQNIASQDAQSREVEDKCVTLWSRRELTSKKISGNRHGKHMGDKWHTRDMRQTKGQGISRGTHHSHRPRDNWEANETQVGGR